MTLIGNHRQDGQFIPTMNKCDLTDLLVRWPTVADGVTVTAYSVDTIADTHGSVTGSNGWIRLGGCRVPGFEFHSSDKGGNLADVTVTVQAWRPTA